jgi:hypothetical protein
MSAVGGERSEADIPDPVVDLLEYRRILQAGVFHLMRIRGSEWVL